MFNIILVLFFYPQLEWDWRTLDSCTNAYQLWNHQKKLIAYNQSADGIQIVNRAYASSTALNCHQTNGAQSFWVDDIGVYNGEYGSPRNPISMAFDAAPYIALVNLISGSYGGIIVEYESGGWWSSFWDPPVDIGLGDINAVMVHAGQLNNGNIIIIGITDADEIFYRTYSPPLCSLIGSGVIASGFYFGGFDVNGDTACLLYYDNSLDIFYHITADGINWSPVDTYDIIWPNPYPNNVILHIDVAVTDSGRPLIVFDNLNGDDPTYPYYGKIYVSYAESESCVEVSSPFGMPDTECIYPTIATGGNLAAIIYNTPRNDLNDSLCWQDIYANWSTDNGITWGTPQNLSSENDSLHLGLQQLAKRIDTLRNHAYFVYGAGRYDPYVYPDEKVYLGFACAPKLGIEETSLHRAAHISEPLEIRPNPFRNKLSLEYTIHDTGCKTSDLEAKIYDASGGLVKIFRIPAAYSHQPITVSWSGTDQAGHAVPAGVYLVQVQNGNQIVTKKVVKLE